MRVLLACVPLLALPALMSPASAEQFAPAAAGHMGGVALTHASAAILAESSAMDEMLRGASGRARRWHHAPDLVVLTSVLQFEGGVRREYVATADALSDEEAAAVAGDLAAGLRLLTDGAYPDFASVRFERTPAGEPTSVMRERTIVVARFNGLLEALEAVGYGGRVVRSDGAIRSGTVMLDAAYDRTDRLRRLLRLHELGHALGFNHVQSQRSIMNPTLGSEPTDFDRRVASIAFRE